MGYVFEGMEPTKVWQNFYNICQVPHPSKKEEKLAAFLLNWASEKGFETQKDELGNFVIRKPATPGMENRKPVVIQGHIDMVCEKNSDVEFDFDNDPIRPVVDGDWVKTEGTTLGADNGIGVAMGLAVLESDDIPHPPLEVLCTLDEETGLTGAMQLGTDLLQADILINLDSEEDGTFTIGCAGGQNTSGTFAYDSENVPADSSAFLFSIKGLQGGHSGIEIHDGRGNALKFVNRFIWENMDKLGIRVASFYGGNAHNAIPREAFAVLVVPNENADAFSAAVKEYDERIKFEYSRKEKGISATAGATDMPARVMTNDMQHRLINSFYAMPHGVYRMSPDIEGLVQTSTNFAVVETRDSEIYALTSQRSSVESEKIDIANMVRVSLELGGAEVWQGDGYPAWEPNMDSAILNVARDIYTDMFDSPPNVEGIHAGLECGLVGEKYPDMDMLSFGPNLKDVHSPDEKLHIPTTVKCFDLLKGILKNIPAK